MSILGNPVLRREDPRLITDGGQFVEDVPLEAAAWVTFVRSTMAHARITGIDVAEAKAAPGVLGVFTRADLGTVLDHLPHIIPVYTDATVRPLLASEVVRYVGEPIVAVVAEDRYAAADAAELVVVDYDPLPVVIDPEAAARDEVLLFPAHGTNTVATMGSKTEADFDGAEVVIELKIHTTGGVIKAGEPLMAIVPRDEPLTIEAQIEPNDIDVVRPGLAAHVRLTRFQSGRAALLDSHRSGSTADQIGVVTDGRIENGLLVVDCQLSPRDDVKPIAEDIAAGILRNVSIGYRVFGSIDAGSGCPSSCWSLGFGSNRFTGSFCHESSGRSSGHAMLRSGRRSVR